MWCQEKWSIQDDELASPQMPSDYLRSIYNMRQIGIAIAGQRRRHADNDHVATRQFGKLRVRTKRLVRTILPAGRLVRNQCETFRR